MGMQIESAIRPHALRGLSRSYGLPAILSRSPFDLKVRYRELRPEKKISSPMSLSRYVRLIKAWACMPTHASPIALTSVACEDVV